MHQMNWFVPHPDPLPKGEGIAADRRRKFVRLGFGDSTGDVRASTSAATEADASGAPSHLLKWWYRRKGAAGNTLGTGCAI